MNNHLFRFAYGGDQYEVTLRGHIIARITCYLSGCHRQDMQYDDLPLSVQTIILEKTKELMEDDE